MTSLLPPTTLQRDFVILSSRGSKVETGVSPPVLSFYLQMRG
jgi:hypothetical protein